MSETVEYFQLSDELLKRCTFDETRTGYFSFSYSVSFPLNFGQSDNVEKSFTTVMAPLSYKWLVTTRNTGGQLQMACSRDQKTILQCPKEVAYCTFEIGVDLGKEVAKASLSDECRDNGWAFGKTTSEEFSTTIQKAGVKERNCRLVVTLKLPASMFTLDLKRGVTLEAMPFQAPAEPEKDFRFVDIYDRTRHNLLFHCNDGVVRTNATAFFKASRHFRAVCRSEEGRKTKEIRIEANTAVMDMLLVYLYTGCFSLSMDALNADFYSTTLPLITTHLPKEYHRQIQSGLELCSIIKVNENRNNLNVLLSWMAIDLSQAPALASVVTAYIVDLHWNEYLIAMANQSWLLAEEQQRVRHMLLDATNGTSIHQRLLDHVTNRSTAVVEELECELY